VALMPCFMGDPDPHLARYADPVEETQLDLWVLVHSDLRRTARVRVFRDFAMERLREQLDLLEGRACGN
jgi:DNA-binding transcriptional LysR family regulator